MQRVDTSTAVPLIPEQNPSGTPGYFTQGNPVTGQPATVPGQDWFNNVQEELIYAILASGQTPNKTDLSQLARAVTILADVRIKLLSAVRNSDEASGDVYYEVGFTPRLIIMFAAILDIPGAMSIGVSTGSPDATMLLFDRSYVVPHSYGVFGLAPGGEDICRLYFSTTGYSQRARLNGTGESGFTLAWTKGGSPPQEPIVTGFIILG